MKPVLVYCDGAWCKETIGVEVKDDRDQLEINQAVIPQGWTVIEYPTERVFTTHRCPQCHDKPNMKVVCTANRSGYEHCLTVGKTYEALCGLEEGIFESDPYITVIGDDGRKTSAHASRFDIGGSDEPKK